MRSYRSQCDTNAKAEEYCDRSQTPTNNDVDEDPSGSKTPTNESDERDQSARERSNFDIEEFARLWGPEPSSSKVNGEGEDIDPSCDSAFSSRSDSFRWSSGAPKTELSMQPLTLEVEANAWDLPEVELMSFNDDDGADRQTQAIAGETGAGGSQNDAWISTEAHSDGETTSDQFSEDDDGVDYDTIRNFLEPDVRPSTPEPNNAASQDIFEEHKKLAKEYLKVSGKIYLAQVEF